MPSFLATLKEFCRAERGRVNELARHLGVAQPHVSAWLTGRQEPSGENTLQMQAWMARADASQDAAPSAPAAERKRSPAKAPSATTPAPSSDDPPVWLL